MSFTRWPACLRTSSIPFFPCIANGTRLRRTRLVPAMFWPASAQLISSPIETAIWVVVSISRAELWLPQSSTNHSYFRTCIGPIHILEHPTSGFCNLDLYLYQPTPGDTQERSFPLAGFHRRLLCSALGRVWSSATGALFCFSSAPTKCVDLRGLPFSCARCICSPRYPFSFSVITAS